MQSLPFHSVRAPGWARFPLKCRPARSAALSYPLEIPRPIPVQMVSAEARSWEDPSSLANEGSR